MLRALPFRLFPSAMPALAAIALLAGCEDPATGARQVSVLGGAFQVAAPSGYCIDSDASQGAADSVVVLIGRCTAEGFVSAALVTVTIGKAASGGVMLAGPAVLGRYFASAPGRQALARDGNPGHVIVTETVADADVLYLRLNDMTAGDYWRAITAVHGRLVTISAVSAPGRAADP